MASNLGEDFFNTHSEDFVLTTLEKLLKSGTDQSVWLERALKCVVKVQYWSATQLLLQHHVTPGDALDYAASTDTVAVFELVDKVTKSLSDTLAEHNLSAGFYLHRAALYGSVRVVELLLRHVGIPDDLSPYTLLADAAVSGNLGMFQRLVDAAVAKTGISAAEILCSTSDDDPTTSILFVAVAEGASDIVAFLCSVLPVEYIANVVLERLGVEQPGEDACGLLAAVTSRDASDPASAAATLGTVRALFAHLCPTDTLALLHHHSNAPLLNATTSLNAPLLRELLDTLARLDPESVPATALAVLVDFMRSSSNPAAGAPRGTALGAACAAVADALLGAAAPGATLTDPTTLSTAFRRNLAAVIRASTPEGEFADGDEDFTDACTLLEAISNCVEGPAPTLELLVALVLPLAPQTRAALSSAWTAAIVAVAGRPVRDLELTPPADKNPFLVSEIAAAAATAAGSPMQRSLCPVCLSARFDCAPVCTGLRAADDEADARLVDRMCAAAAGGELAELVCQLGDGDRALEAVLPVHKPQTLAALLRTGLSVVSSNVELEQMFSLPEDLSDRVPEAAARIVAAWAEVEKAFAGKKPSGPDNANSRDTTSPAGTAQPPASLLQEFEEHSGALHNCVYTATVASAPNCLRWLLRSQTLRMMPQCRAESLLQWLRPQSHISPGRTRETLDLVLSFLDQDASAADRARLLLGLQQNTPSLVAVACASACKTKDSWPFLEGLLASGATVLAGHNLTVLHVLLNSDKSLYTSNNDLSQPLRRIIDAVSASEARRAALQCRN
jgi:hypothetical protein